MNVLAGAIYTCCTFFVVGSITINVTDWSTRKRHVALLRDLPVSPKYADIEDYCQEAADIEFARSNPLVYTWTLATNRRMTSSRYPFVTKKDFVDPWKGEQKTQKLIILENINRLTNVMTRKEGKPIEGSTLQTFKSDDHS